MTLLRFDFTRLSAFWSRIPRHAQQYVESSSRLIGSREANGYVSACILQNENNYWNTSRLTEDQSASKHYTAGLRRTEKHFETHRSLRSTLNSNALCGPTQTHFCANQSSIVVLAIKTRSYNQLLLYFHAKNPDNKRNPFSDSNRDTITFLCFFWGIYWYMGCLIKC